MSRGVANELNTSIDPDVRKKMLKRIGDLGKGRFAQRLASRIAQVDLDARIRSEAGITDDLVPLDEQALRRLGTASYLFLAMDHISRAARGTSLLTDQAAPHVSGQGNDADQ
ncbi:hypothetical protein ABT187_47450 [Streptomyces sp. NPDC001817]|uniref:hypothetical protein n=1 Tax=Streptomyces sp. NPDC001817 TaxID=3154398 RepID=UPI00331E18EB